MKSLKSKKAMDILMGTIMVLLIFGVLLMLVAQLFGGLKMSMEEKLCFADALQNSLIKNPIGGYDVFQLTNCPIIGPVDIHERDLNKKPLPIYKKYKKDTKYYKATSTNHELPVYNANRIIAEHMKSCWSKLGEGALPLFVKWEDTYISLKKCVVCSVIRFDKDAVNKIKGKKGETSITSLREWLNNHPVPGKSPKISYTEYFKDPNTKMEQSDLWLQKYEYDVEEKLAVIYVKSTASKLKGLGKKVIAKLTGDTYEAENIDYLLLIPYTQQSMGLNCNKKMN